MNVQIDPSWKEALAPLFDKPYFGQIVAHLKTEKALNKIIYPKGSLIFNAFEQTKLEQVKVIILGQDPYHNPGQAMGLSFSVPDGVKVPPSLVNIYKELKTHIVQWKITPHCISNFWKRGYILDTFVKSGTQRCCLIYTQKRKASILLI